MSTASYERLSALDAAMIFVETPAVHMHVGVVGILEAGPLATADGGVDVERIRSHVGGVLDELPRFRQRLAFVPVEDHPVWVDDDRFDPSYHVRHAGLPRPGTARQLKRLTGHILSQKLDLAKPPWEVWVIEGLEGGRFALVCKMHHCLVDGIAAVYALSAFFSVDAGAADHPPSRWVPRPRPSPTTLAAGELRRLVAAPLGLVRAGASAWSDPVRALRSLRDLAQGAVEVVADKMRPPSSTPLNPDLISPHRRVDWLRFDLERVKSVRRRLGGKLNDVVLAMVAGALRRYLLAHDVALDGLEFRIVIPVNTRSDLEQGASGNRVVPLLARLPLENADVRGRLRQVIDTTQALKESHQVEAVELFEDLSNWASAELLSALVRRTTPWWSGNMIVTNVPGPPLPLHMLGARVLECYPMIPLLANQAVSIAILSYAGGLFCSLNSDRDALPDLHALTGCIDDELAALEEAAAAEGEPRASP
jgi:WS/DGAT/MGAT family acyltransferase